MSNLGLLALYVLGFILIFYFMAIRPQQRQRRAHEQMVSAVRKGDQVVTAGGIVGSVRRTDDNFVMLEVAKGVQLKVARRAIAEITSKTETTMVERAEEPAAIEVAEEDAFGSPFDSTEEPEEK